MLYQIKAYHITPYHIISFHIISSIYVPRSPRHIMAHPRRTLLRLQRPETAERCAEGPGGGGEDRPVHRASLSLQRDETWGGSKRWENHGKIMGKLENHGKIMGKLKKIRKSCKYLGISWNFIAKFPTFQWEYNENIIKIHGEVNGNTLGTQWEYREDIHRRVRGEMMFSRPKNRFKMI